MSRWHFDPVTIGPTWQRNAAGDDYVTPELTLGWQAKAWADKNLLSDEEDPFTGKKLPFVLTREQLRFVLWWYAIDERGVFCYRDGILQRLKGWGKDPLAAYLAAIEFVGPCRFAGWAAKDMPELGLVQGDPVAKGHPRALVQIAAVSMDQTSNTMALFPGFFTEACMAEHLIVIHKEVIYAYGGQRVIKAVTSSPKALEGRRPTFSVRNETHLWVKSNAGIAMAEVIERNLTKSKDGSARALSITNAYEPGDGSVGEIQRKAWSAENDGRAIDTGVLYDSLEAPMSARLRPPQAKTDPEPSDDEIKEYLAAVIEAVRGDSKWLNIERIVQSILSGQTNPSVSRRFWFNQIVDTEDAWVPSAAVDAALEPYIGTLRGLPDSDVLRIGWTARMDEPMAVFFDGSKSDDSTALVGCSLETGQLVTLGVWQKPLGDRGKNWLAPREAVDERVDEMMQRFNVVAFWGDPSHTTDDADSTSYWVPMMDDWHQRYKDRLQLWAQMGGAKPHAIIWDMSAPDHLKSFVAAAMQFVEDITAVDDIEEFAPRFFHDGHPALVTHLKNARSIYNPKYGTTLAKEHRESTKKIDLAVCAVGAKMLARLISNRGLEEPAKKGGKFWSY